MRPVNDDEIIILESEGVPVQIKAWKRHPKTLWCMGDVSLLDQKLVSVIGSRDATQDGMARARRITQLLVKHGFVVVSGMAEGIDATSHFETLRNGGKTIAVMGTPIDQCYPIQHQDLKQDIVHHGLVVSQFPPGSFVSRGNFPQRNELMAALSLLTIVAEAGPNSGTRHQVASAVALGRRVGFVASLINKKIPWVDITLEKGSGFVITQPEDLLKELAAFIPEGDLAVKLPPMDSSETFLEQLPPVAEIEEPKPVEHVQVFQAELLPVTEAELEPPSQPVEIPQEPTSATPVPPGFFKRIWLFLWSLFCGKK